MHLAKLKHSNRNAYKLDLFLNLEFIKTGEGEGERRGTAISVGSAEP